MTRSRGPLRVIQFTHIERTFKLVPLRMGDEFRPAVWCDDQGTYHVRILTHLSVSASGEQTEKFDYFRATSDGAITMAPYGYAKDYKPGRIPVVQLDAAVRGYAAHHG